MREVNWKFSRICCPFASLGDWFGDAESDISTTVCHRFGRGGEHLVNLGCGSSW